MGEGRNLNMSNATTPFVMTDLNGLGKTKALVGSNVYDHSIQNGCVKLHPLNVRMKLINHNR